MDFSKGQKTWLPPIFKLIKLFSYSLVYTCYLSDVILQQNTLTVVHFITARRLVVPSSNLFSFIYCPDPSTFSRLALIFSDNSPDTSSKSLTSLLLLTTWYLKENLLESMDLIGKSVIDGKTSAHAFEVSKSNVRPRHRVGDV